MDISSWALVKWQIIFPMLATLLVVLIRFLSRFQAGWSRYFENRIGVLQEWVTILASACSLIITLILAIGPIVHAPFSHRLWIIDFYLDALSIYFLLLVNTLTFFASLYTGPYFKLQERSHPGSNKKGSSPTRFHFFFNIFHFTMVLVPVVDDLIFLWIAVELTTVASALLVGFRRDRRALEAAWKYIIITSTGIIFALLGTLFLANTVQESQPMNWSLLVKAASGFDKNSVMLSFLFILLGYGTKAGFAPMHTWLPDGHGEAPYPISALLSGVLLKCALYAILRFYTITNITLEQEVFTSRLLLISGLFSLMLATPFILKRNYFKRVLAYHSLEHMGIITFGIGIGGQIALFGAMLHTLNHALTKGLMFLAYGNVQISYVNSTKGNEDSYVGVLKALPKTGMVLALGGLALVGTPPFSIFFSEFIILWGAINKATQYQSAWYISAIVLFLISVTLIFVGLVRHLGHILLGMPPSDVGLEKECRVFPLIILLLIILLMGVVIPTIGPLNFSDLITESVNIIQSGSGGRLEGLGR